MDESKPIRTPGNPFWLCPRCGTVWPDTRNFCTCSLVTSEEKKIRTARPDHRGGVLTGRASPATCGQKKFISARTLRRALARGATLAIAGGQIALSSPQSLSAGINSACANRHQWRESVAGERLVIRDDPASLARYSVVQHGSGAEHGLPMALIDASRIACVSGGQPILFASNGGVASADGHAPKCEGSGGYCRGSRARVRGRLKVDAPSYDARRQSPVILSLRAGKGMGLRLTAEGPLCWPGARQLIEEPRDDIAERLQSNVKTHSTLRIVSRNGQPWQVVRSALRRHWRGALFAQSIGREARACASHIRGQL